ncbi:DUF2306 domain-containing protein [Devosia sp. D6-9]|nr:DUF2306 domain-containing protein [Devosia sp. D6-9]
MTLEPLLSASPIIQIHAYAAIAAFILGACVLFRRKGDARHKAMGRFWVALMAVVAVSSLFIWEIRTFGLFSPIHILSLVTLYGLYKGVGHACARRIALHRRTMQALYLGALGIAGIFTLAPGRIMHRVVFGVDAGFPLNPFVLAAGIALALLAGWLVLRARRLPEA